MAEAAGRISGEGERMSLPLRFRGCSTAELLNQWEKVRSGAADGSGNATAWIMNDFLETYRLCPTSWSTLAWEEDKERAELLIAELKERTKKHMPPFPAVD